MTEFLLSVVIALGGVAMGYSFGHDKALKKVTQFGEMLNRWSDEQEDSFNKGHGFLHCATVYAACMYADESDYSMFEYHVGLIEEVAKMTAEGTRWSASWVEND